MLSDCIEGIVHSSDTLILCEQRIMILVQIAGIQVSGITKSNEVSMFLYFGILILKTTSSMIKNSSHVVFCILKASPFICDGTFPFVMH